MKEMIGVAIVAAVVVTALKMMGLTGAPLMGCAVLVGLVIGSVIGWVLPL